MPSITFLENSRPCFIRIKIYFPFKYSSYIYCRLKTIVIDFFVISYLKFQYIRVCLFSYKWNCVLMTKLERYVRCEKSKFHDTLFNNVFVIMAITRHHFSFFIYLWRPN